MPECACGCGQTPAKATSRFMRGHNATKHGAHGSSTYATWRTAKQRTTNPRNHKWPAYGGRGITMCARYRDDYTAFLFDMGERPAGRTLDRVDNDAGYSCGRCPECIEHGRRFNLRWATPSEQRLNRRGRAKATPKPCSEEGCRRPHYAKGLCFNAYMRDFRREREEARDG